MPDYSGYAPRQQQQDPNLAAWAQIGGNIANIFGLDPAKAAEARRGLQQEDYNELRNQAQIRQQLANKRVGELLGGKGFDTARGEFVDPVAYQQFVQAMSDLGDARQAIPFGPGRWDAQQQSRIDADNRSFDYKAGVQAKRDEKEAAKQAEALKKAEVAAAASENEKLAKRYTQLRQFGGKEATYNVRTAWDDFMREFTASAPKSRSERFVETPETAALPEDKRQYNLTAAWIEWMDKHGLGSPIAENENVRYRDDAFLGAQNQLLAKLSQVMQLPANNPHLLDLADRIYASHINKQIQEQEAPVPAVETQAEVDQVMKKAAADPANAPRYMLVRIPVVNPEDGTVSFQHKFFSVGAVARMKPDNPNHPINILQRAR
jgi:hypothetical protein